MTRVPISQLPSVLRGGGAFGWVDRHLLPVLVLELEFHDPIHEGEQRVIVRPAYVSAGVKFGAPLADQDIPGDDFFPSIPLYTQVLGIARPAVPAGAYTLLMCHMLNPA